MISLPIAFKYDQQRSHPITCIWLESATVEKSHPVWVESSTEKWTIFSDCSIGGKSIHGFIRAKSCEEDSEQHVGHIWSLYDFLGREMEYYSYAIS